MKVLMATLMVLSLSTLANAETATGNTKSATAPKGSHTSADTKGSMMTKPEAEPVAPKPTIDCSKITGPSHDDCVKASQAKKM